MMNPALIKITQILTTIGKSKEPFYWFSPRPGTSSLIAVWKLGLIILVGTTVLLESNGLEAVYNTLLPKYSTNRI
jgi:hypothetical protein